MLPAVSGIAQNGGRTFLSRDNGEIYSLGEELSLLGRARGEYSGYRLSEAGGRNFLVGGGGIFEIRDNRLVRFGNGPDGEPGSNFVSALYADAKGQIWMGAFRGGIDVRTGEGRLIKHIGSEGIHEINFLGAGPNGSVVAATTGGLVKIDGSLSPIGGADDRMAGPVNHVSGDLLSTPRGLLFAKKEGSKLLTAENRLPSNSVYTTLSKGGSIWVGTLSGLAQVRGERVVRVWKDSNSRLTTNWVTALASVGERIFIGTYGGGVYEILPSGEVHSLLSAGEGFVVNMNALDTNGKRLYAGTMDGIRSMDLETGAWETFRTGLPAKTVMSIIHNRGRIYAGTTNGVAVIGDDEFGLQERAAK
jgi:ligand-binding sensor domain-containing protein